jgi:hypothetical protein
VTPEGLSGGVRAVSGRVTGGTVVTRPVRRDDQANRVVDVDNWLATLDRFKLQAVWTRALHKMLDHPDLSFLQALESVWADQRGPTDA